MLEMYVLKHKDERCGLVSIETGDGSPDEYVSANKNTAPFLGNDTRELMKKWWMARCVPAARKAIYEVIRLSGCGSAGEYLAKNLSLSMTDCYWICPMDADLRWDDVNLWVSGKMMGGRIPYHNATSYDPNASLGGQMEKYWDMTGPVPLLVKTAGMHYGQQAITIITIYSPTTQIMRTGSGRKCRKRCMPSIRMRWRTWRRTCSAA